MKEVSDPFRDKRNKEGMLVGEFGGEKVPMILRHEEVRKAAKDWKTFSSNAPFRVPIPSEENVRTMRQLPVIERRRERHWASRPMPGFSLSFRGAENSRSGITGPGSARLHCRCSRKAAAIAFSWRPRRWEITPTLVRLPFVGMTR